MPSEQRLRDESDRDSITRRSKRMKRFITDGSSGPFFDRDVDRGGSRDRPPAATSSSSATQVVFDEERSRHRRLTCRARAKGEERRLAESHSSSAAASRGCDGGSRARPAACAQAHDRQISASEHVPGRTLGVLLTTSCRRRSSQLERHRAIAARSERTATFAGGTCSTSPTVRLWQRYPQLGRRSAFGFGARLSCSHSGFARGVALQPGRRRQLAH